jgi:hypothetical protein
MNIQLKRLYEAAKALKDVTGVAAVAKVLDSSPQTLNNWRDRPISAEGLIAAQEKIGCDALWLRDGIGEMTRGKQVAQSYDDLMRLMSIFADLPGDLKGDLLAYSETIHAAWTTSITIDDKSQHG